MLQISAFLTRSRPEIKLFLIRNLQFNKQMHLVRLPKSKGFKSVKDKF